MAKKLVIEEVEEKKVDDVEIKETRNEDVSSESNTQVEQSEPAGQVETEEEKPNYLWLIVLTALLVGALAGGLITYFSGISTINNPSPVPTIVSTPEPTTTPDSDNDLDEELNREDIKIQVLNGSGVSGAAGKAKALLEKIGYKDVATGNASNSNFEVTEISIKSTRIEYLDMLKVDLGEDYELEEESKSLSATSSYDVVITIGKK